SLPEYGGKQRFYEKKKDSFLLGASSKENKESRNPYDDKGFRLSYDIEILFDMFSSEDSRRNSP
ncbi:hypothetical protein, partial [Anaerotignum lactatifermentans]|uniref:hypothetical protein n=1 Tax=Anaerotignum lactatifermentans TaxID=160404 RepID=UPI0030793C51